MIMTGFISPSDLREKLHLVQSVQWFAKNVPASPAFYLQLRSQSCFLPCVYNSGPAKKRETSRGIDAVSEQVVMWLSDQSGVNVCVWENRDFICKDIKVDVSL